MISEGSTERIPNGAAPSAGPRLHAELTLVTPEMAARWLENGKNFRAFDKAHALKIAGDIQKKGWKHNGETFKLNRAGQMFDGQHRAWAIQYLEISVYSLVALDVEDDTGIDEGKRRTINQHLRYCGERYTDSLASALRYLGLWHLGKLHFSGVEVSRLFTNNDLLGLLQEHPTIRESVLRVHPIKGKTGAPSGQLAMLHYLAGQEGLGNEVERFLRDLESGTNLQEDDPVWQLRKRLLANRSSRSKLPPIDKLALILRAWTYWITGRRCRTLRWNGVGPSAEPFPEFVLTRPADDRVVPGEQA